MKNQNCNKNLTKLYSSTQFVEPADSKEFGKWDKDCTLKILVHLLSVYTPSSGPNIYFRAKVTLDVNVVGNMYQKSNIKVKEICFKNEFNVSANSLTNEYEYLYDISCRTADNNNSSDSKCSFDFSNIINEGIEKQIATNVKAFFESDAFTATHVHCVGNYTLDASQFMDGTIFPNVKTIIKQKVICPDTSSCTYHSSSGEICPSNNILKILIIAAVVMFCVMLLGKLNNNYEKNHDYKNNGLLGVVKGLFGSLFGTYGNYPTPQPYVKPEPEPEEQK